MILYYTGTGNSAFVANEMGRLTNDRVERITIESNTRVELHDDEMLGIVFPVHSWGLPKRVAEFLERISLNRLPSRCYVVMTCGDDSGLANEQMERVLLKKGIKTRHIYSVRMPNTYMLFPGFDVDPEPLRNEKIAETTALLPRLADAVMNDEPIQQYVKTDKSWLKSKVIYPLFMRHMMSDKPFYTTDQCTGCGRCERECPEKNIRMENGRPSWQGHCTQCLGCINRCPQKAIEYGKKSVGKGRSQL